MNIRETLWKHRPEKDIRWMMGNGGSLLQAMIVDPVSQPRRSFEELDAVIGKAADKGTSVFIYTGSEPLVRMYDLIRICDRHRECLFVCITGGSLIDEDFESEMKRVGNFVPLTIRQEGCSSGQ